MQEMFEQIIGYLRGVWLKRRYILIVVWVVCPIGWAMVTMLPSQFTSEARIHADTRSILQPLLRGLAIQTDPTKELELMVKTLLSRSNLETIARNVDADVRARNSQQYEQVIKNLGSNIQIHSAGRENLYTISYSGSDPIYVKNVVQAALNVFVENTLSEQRLDTDNASKIITTQIEDYESRLIDAEQKLAEFKREYFNFMPGSGNGYRQQLEQNKGALETAQLQLKETKTRFDSVRSQMLKEEQRAKRDISKIRTEYDDRIESLQQRLDDLLFRYTDKHPDVIETRRQLKELQDVKDAKLSSFTADEALKNNLIYQDLKMNYGQLENEVASLNTRVEQYKSRINELQASLDKVPDVEAKLTALTRNYDITKDKYEQLLSRKESALISKSVDNSSDDIKFRIIDPPRVPDKPSGPPRVMLLVAVLIFSLGAGGGISFLFSQISPVISSSRDLVQSLELPVLGIVSATEVSGLIKWEKRKMRVFIFSNILLLGLFAAFLAMNMMPPLREELVQSFNTIVRDRFI
ncbi:XrtA system polysaccharide chain length determinant [Vibrio ziniensis]|uniref:Chain length determinant family protein n=1 Tax=Vibrio ziniensis TaxID=2711221 RepID=A0A6G7CQW0_9VIBR|nr:XrtA system polysaccharide chain length determinant [Vibrio ziniensis]QIH44495.1 chain length determinant family protein [Vibrio ziniensis]